MSDLGLTHIALPVTDIEASVAFYSRYARMSVVHRRKDSESEGEVVWISDHTRPFVVVLISTGKVEHPLRPWAWVARAARRLIASAGRRKPRAGS